MEDHSLINCLATEIIILRIFLLQKRSDHYSHKAKVSSKHCPKC